jgi:hypothetical protein
MMKTQIFIFIMFLFLNGIAQNASVYNYSLATSKITFFDIADDKNCGSFISGLNQTDNKLFVIHLNALGDTLWAKAFDFTPYVPVVYDFKISVSDSGIYFLAGKFNILPTTNISYFIIGKLDTLGNLIWAKSTKSSFYISSCIANDNDKVYCSFSSSEGDSLKLFKFDSNGNHLWRKAITIPSGFQLPNVSDILFVNYDRVLVVGRLSGYANYAHLGSFCLWLNKQTGFIFPMSRIYTNSQNNKFITFSNVNVNHQLYMCGATLTSGIMVSKHNLSSGQSLSKHLFSSLDNINAKTIHLTDSSHLLITGIITSLNNKTQGLHIELDTNLNLLSSNKFEDPNNLINIRLNKSINNCGINKTIGTISDNNFSNGYMLNKAFGIDSVCNQENYLIQDSLFNDTTAYYTPSEQLTNEWSNISFSQSNLFFHKQNCLTTNSLEENSTIIETNLYPNPTNTGNFIIESNEVIYSIILFNILGETVFTESSVNKNYFNFHCSDLRSGIYFVNIEYKSRTINKKVIIDNH